MKDKKNKDCNCPTESIEELYQEFSGEESKPLENIVEMNSFSDEDSTPNLVPPFEDESNMEEGFGAGTWHNNKKVHGLWTKDQTRNSWASYTGLGWKKLNSSNNSSCVALSILAAHAKQYNKNTKIKIDGGQIKEMYVW